MPFSNALSQQAITYLGYVQGKLGANFLGNDTVANVELSDYIVLLVKYQRIHQPNSFPLTDTSPNSRPLDNGTLSPEEMIERSTKEAAKIEREVKKDKARKAICAALENISKDTFDIAKSVIPVLATLALTGVIATPATPLFITLAAIIVARMGVAALCLDEKKT